MCLVFQRGERVVYGIHGVCEIVDVEVKMIDRKKKEFYVLAPVGQQGARFYVPTGNQAAVAKLRPVISQEELRDLLRSEQTTRDAWIPDENQRKQKYRELITSGDRAALIGMVHTLHQRKCELSAAGKKFHLCDENFLRDAQKLLGSEFSLVLDIEQNEVEDYVMEMLQCVK